MASFRFGERQLRAPSFPTAGQENDDSENEIDAVYTAVDAVIYFYAVSGTHDPEPTTVFV